MAETNEGDPITGKKLNRLTNYNGSDNVNPQSTIPRLTSYNPSTLPDSQRGGTGDISMYDFTATKYDNPQTYVEDLPHLDDIRSKNQGILSSVGNSLAKFVGKTGVSVIGGLAGTVYGAAKAVEEGDISKLWNNSLMDSLDKIDQDLGDTFKVYKTSDYEKQNILQRAFLHPLQFLDDTTEALSFTAGAILTEYITAGLGNAAIGGKAINLMKNLGRGAEAVEATSQLTSGLSKALRGLGDAGTLTRQLATGAGYESMVEARQATMEARNNMYKDWATNNPGIAMPDEVKADIDDRLSKAGLFTYLSNLALVGSTNIAQFPKIFGVGAKTASIAEGSIIRNAETGLFEAAGSSKLGKVKSLLHGAYEEGIKEEGLQNVIHGTAVQYWDRKNDGKAKDDVNEFLNVAMKNLANTYTSKEGWNDIGMGMIIGSLGAPGKGIFSVFGKNNTLGQQGYEAVRNDKGEIVDYKRKNIWEGGIIGSVREHNEEHEAIAATVNELNKTDGYKAMKANYDFLVTNRSLQGEQDKAVQTGDIFAFNNAKDDQTHAYISSRIKAGLYESVEDDLKDMGKLSPDDFYTQFKGDAETEKATDREKTKFKLDTIEQFKQKAANTKEAFDIAEDVYRGDNEDLREELIHSIAASKNLDVREKSMNQSLADMSNGLINNYNIRSTGTVNITDHIKELESQLKDAESPESKEAIQTQIKDLQSAKNQNLTVDEHNKLADLSRLDPTTYAINKDKIVNMLQDSKRLRSLRQNYINLFNNLFTEEGQKAFNNTQLKQAEDDEAKLSQVIADKQKKEDDKEVKKNQKATTEKVKKQSSVTNPLNQLKSGRMRFETDTRTGDEIVSEFKAESGKISQKNTLNHIINSEFSNDGEKEIARKLLTLTKDEDTISIDNKLNGPGNYNHVTGILNMNLHGHGLENGIITSVETIIIHELIHKYTLDQYHSDKNFNKQINDLFNAASKVEGAESFYGMTKPEEMITEGLTSPDFQEFLATIPYKNTIKSFWNKFLDIISKALKGAGLNLKDNTLGELIGLTTRSIDSLVIDQAVTDLGDGGNNFYDKYDLESLKKLLSEVNHSRDFAESAQGKESYDSTIQRIEEEIARREITAEEKVVANIVNQEEVYDVTKELKEDGLVISDNNLNNTNGKIKFENTTRQREVGNTIISLNVDYIETVLGDVDTKSNQQRIFDTYDDEGKLIINENFDSRLQSPNQFSPGDNVRIIVPTYADMEQAGGSYSESDFNTNEFDVDRFPIAFVDSNDKIIGYLPTRDNVAKRVNPNAVEAELIKNRQLRETIYNNRDSKFDVKITRKSPGSLLLNKVNRSLYEALGDGKKLGDGVSIGIYKDSRLQTSLGTNANESLINKEDLKSGYIYSVIPTAEKGNYIAAPMTVTKIGSENAEIVLRLIQLYKANESFDRDKDFVAQRKELAREIDLSNNQQFNEVVSSIMYTSNDDDAYMLRLTPTKLYLGPVKELSFAWNDVMLDPITQQKIIDTLTDRYHSVQLSKFGNKFNQFVLKDGKLDIVRHDNYFDYLDQNQVIETNIQGFPVQGTNNERYFTGQSVIEFSTPILSDTKTPVEEANIIEPLQIGEEVANDEEPGTSEGEAKLASGEASDVEMKVPDRPKNKLGVKFKPKNNLRIEEDFDDLSTIENIEDIDKRAEELMKKCGL